MRVILLLAVVAACGACGRRGNLPAPIPWPAPQAATIQPSDILVFPTTTLVQGLATAKRAAWLCSASTSTYPLAEATWQPCGARIQTGPADTIQIDSTVHSLALRFHRHGKAQVLGWAAHPVSQETGAWAWFGDDAPGIPLEAEGAVSRVVDNHNGVRYFGPPVAVEP